MNAGAYYQQFVYVETEKMEPTGLYLFPDERIKAGKENFGYSYEEYGLYDGDIKVTRAELDDNSALINGQLNKLNGNAELRVRYLTPYNFLVAAHNSPINNKTFDRNLEEILNGILENTTTLDALKDKVLSLPKRGF